MAEASYRKIDDVRQAGLGALEKAHRAGVSLVYGSDLLGPMHAHRLEESTLRAQVQPNADLIRPATTTAARLLGMDGRIGTLAIGAHADPLVVDGDPVEDVSVLTRPHEHLRRVIKEGVPIDPTAGVEPPAAHFREGWTPAVSAVVAASPSPQRPRVRRPPAPASSRRASRCGRRMSGATGCLRSRTGKWVAAARRIWAGWISCRRTASMNG
ncbi:amidohydrolase family protein [Planobispora siamensis]|uniref:Amidohydrolase-related domain-containing protein n=1 Tax=Planobispora siamensis TaxID=936338 RepID=A0A8J3WM17_9ACTN|nr:amidohydrolase family protein [Planobispora siamensis]GIH95929.1 hypothetical protein Psi01_65590 [Planobispora siamensis]